MMISIITVAKNSKKTITDTVRSVIGQTYKDVEYIVVDGASEDGTLDVLKPYANGIRKIISEPDAGMYDAMNKGIALATGDIVGILNADDYYNDEHVLSKVANIFDTSSVDALFADLVYVKPANLNKIVRYYSGANFTLSKLSFGWMPPHPTFFVKRECYLKYGFFKTDYKIAADFELLARFLAKHRIRCQYLPEIIVKMRTGGTSTRSINSNLILNREILRACSENGIATNMLKIYSKYFGKCMQLFSKPR